MFVNQLTFINIKNIIKTLLPNFVAEEKQRSVILKTMTIAVVDDYIEVIFNYKNKEEKIILYDFEFTTTLLDQKDTILIAEYRKLMALNFLKRDYKGESYSPYLDAMLKYIKRHKVKKQKQNNTSENSLLKD